MFYYAGCVSLVVKIWRELDGRDLRMECVGKFVRLRKNAVEIPALHGEVMRRHDDLNIVRELPELLVSLRPDDGLKSGDELDEGVAGLATGDLFKKEEHGT